MTTTPLDLDAVTADIKQAHDEICNIAEGKRRWTMSIPAKEVTDSDLVISRALAGAERVLDELAKTRAELDEVKREVHLLKHTDDGRLFVAETLLAEAKAALRDADTWIERVGMTTEAVIIMAEDKTPGLALIADLALWNDHRRALLGDTTPDTPAAT